MKRRWIIATMLATWALVAATGCGRDMKRMFQTNPQMRERVIQMVSTDSTLAGPVS